MAYVLFENPVYYPLSLAALSVLLLWNKNLDTVIYCRVRRGGHYASRAWKLLFKKVICLKTLAGSTLAPAEGNVITHEPFSRQAGRTYVWIKCWGVWLPEKDVIVVTFPSFPSSHPPSRRESQRNGTRENTLSLEEDHLFRNWTGVRRRKRIRGRKSPGS